MFQAANRPNPAAAPYSNWYSRRIKFYIHRVNNKIKSEISHVKSLQDKDTT